MIRKIKSPKLKAIAKNNVKARVAIEEMLRKAKSPDVKVFVVAFYRNSEGYAAGPFATGFTKAWVNRMFNSVTSLDPSAHPLKK